MESAKSFPADFSVSSPLPESSDSTSVPTHLLTPAAQERWFQEQVYPHGVQLKSYLLGSFPLIRDIEDVVQESYLRIWKARAAHPIESSKAFLFTIARHVALKESKKKRDAVVEFVGDLSALKPLEGGLNAFEALNYNEKVSLLAEALTRLPARCRTIVILRKLRFLSQKEVAAQLRLSERTVENQLARGISRCRDFFRKRGADKLS